jgi:hypothetical protein
MNLHALKSICIISSTIIFTSTVYGQSTKEDYLKTIPTALPFLTITPDARAGAMADVGVATSADANATFWNPAKLAFNESDMGVSLAYNPWLRKLVNDMSLSYLSGYKKLRKEDAIAMNFKYFDLGEVQFTDLNGNPLQVYSPNEMTIGGYYSRLLSKKFSMGLGLKYYRSNLVGNGFTTSSGQIIKPINSAGVDIGCYYTNSIFLFAKKSQLSFGANISDIGPKVTYSSPDNKDFIPTNLRIGTAVTIEADPYNRFTLGFDINKLLVPSPPLRDSAGNIVKGTDPNEVGVLGGMIRSFGDAPGGFKEEMQEYILCMSGEYWYTDLFAVRAGYHYENPNKGNRRYVTVGIGVRYQGFGLDMAYLIPVQQNNPLAESLRFTLMYNFKAKKRADSVQDND